MKTFRLGNAGASLFALLLIVATQSLAATPQLAPGTEEVILKVENMT